MIGLAIFITLVVTAALVAALIKANTPKQDLGTAAEQAQVKREAARAVWQIQMVANRAIAEMVAEAGRQEGDES